MTQVLKWFDLWPRVRQRGAGTDCKRAYLLGASAGLRMVAFKRHNRQDGDLLYSVFVAERQARQDSQESDPPPRGQSSRNARRSRPGRARTPGTGILSGAGRSPEQLPRHDLDDDPDDPSGDDDAEAAP
jgi:hypothetical protein